MDQLWRLIEESHISAYLSKQTRDPARGTFREHIRNIQGTFRKHSVNIESI
jgi:hypothetical protein